MLEITKVLTKVATFYNETPKEELTLYDLIKLGLTGSQSKQRREKVQNTFN